MGEDKGPYQEGKRAGLHPLVGFRSLLGHWLFVADRPQLASKRVMSTKPRGPVIEIPKNPVISVSRRFPT
jgi:hypothetical protein